MERISKINDKTPSYRGVKRIFYRYDENIAKHVWMGIATKIVDEPLGWSESTGENVASCWANLLKYAHGDDSCEYDLNKAIALVGPTGTAKTTSMRILREYLNIDHVRFVKNDDILSFKYKTITEYDLIKRFSNGGYDSIDNFYKTECLCLDDVGTLNPFAKHYGESVNIIKMLFEERYRNNKLTHFTSNLPIEHKNPKVKSIYTVYGDRMYSRIVETTNIIKLNDKDYRRFKS